MKRLLFVTMPTCAAFGSLIPGVGAIFAFRLVVLLLGLQALASNKATLKGLRSVATFRLLVVLWTLVGLVGSFFVQSFDVAVRAILPLFLGFILMYVFITAKDSRRVLNSLQTGWVVAFIVTGALAVREMVTGARMSNYLPTIVDLSAHTIDPRLVASVFGNPNAYGAFLVTAFPFLVYGLLNNEARWMRYCYVGLIVTLCVLMLSTGSRLSLFALLLEGMFFARYAGRRYWRSLVGGALLILLGYFFISDGTADSIVSRLPGKLTTAAQSNLGFEVFSGDSATSGSRRLNLYMNGLWMVGNSAGLGVGPGNFEVVMASGEAPFDAGGVVDPHNLYLEIASQYGLLVFVSFILWIGACFRVCSGAARCGEGRARSWGVTMVAAVVGNSVSALASSSYLPGSINWVFLGTFFLVTVMIERSTNNVAPLTPVDHDRSRPSSRHVLA